MRPSQLTTYSLPGSSRGSFSGVSTCFGTFYPSNMRAWPRQQESLVERPVVLHTGAGHKMPSHTSWPCLPPAGLQPRVSFGREPPPPGSSSHLLSTITCHYLRLCFYHRPCQPCHRHRLHRSLSRRSLFGPPADPRLPLAPCPPASWPGA